MPRSLNVKNVLGDTRIWTMDLSDCSRLLYHWAISPHVENYASSRERQVGVTCQNCQSPLAVVKRANVTIMLASTPFLNTWSVGGIMVSIAAFQAVDPGSIPGRRSFCFFLLEPFKSHLTFRGSEPRPLRGEPVLQISWSYKLTLSKVACISKMPPWRNWLARSAVNRKVGGSSPPGGEKFFFTKETVGQY